MTRTSTSRYVTLGLLAIVASSSSAKADSFSDACAAARSQLGTIGPRLTPLERSPGRFVPPAPPTYEVFCREEPDYASRDRLQEENATVYQDHLLHDLTTLTRELVQTGVRLEPCGGEADGRTYAALMARIHSVALARMTATIAHFRGQRGAGKFDVYWPVIRALLANARAFAALGADVDGVVDGAAAMTLELTHEMIRRVRIEHDYRYTPKALLSLLRGAEAVGALDVSATAALIQRILATFTFDVTLRNVSRLAVDGGRWNYETVRAGQRIELTADGFVPRVLDIAYVTGRVVTENGSGTLTSPSSFATTFGLAFLPCIDEPRIDLSVDRFGAETETFHVVDPDAEADASYPSLLHAWTLSLLQMNGSIRGVDADGNARAPEASRRVATPFGFVEIPVGEQAGEEPGTPVAWRFTDFPLRNRNPEIGDRVYQARMPGVDMSTRYTLEITHAPQ